MVYRAVWRQTSGSIRTEPDSVLVEYDRWETTSVNTTSVSTRTGRTCPDEANRQSFSGWTVITPRTTIVGGAPEHPTRMATLVPSRPAMLVLEVRTPEW